MNIEVMKLWLKALETSWYHVGTFCPTDAAIELYDEARDSLHQAIEQAEKQKPVAWLQFKDNEPPVVAPRNLGTPVFKTPQRQWVKLMRGVRVENDAVIISTKGGNEAARELCGALIAEMNGIKGEA